MAAEVNTSQSLCAIFLQESVIFSVLMSIVVLSMLVWMARVNVMVLEKMGHNISEDWKKVALLDVLTALKYLRF